MMEVHGTLNTLLYKYRLFHDYSDSILDCNHVIHYVIIKLHHQQEVLFHE